MVSTYLLAWYVGVLLERFERSPHDRRVVLVVQEFHQLRFNIGEGFHLGMNFGWRCWCGHRCRDETCIVEEQLARALNPQCFQVLDDVYLHMLASLFFVCKSLTDRSLLLRSS